MSGRFGVALLAALLAGSDRPQPAVVRADQHVSVAGERATAAALLRAQWYGTDNRYMSPYELVVRSRQRRRARQTHRGKRGRA